MSKRNLTTSIVGDAGAAEATVVPNLESLNTGADSYVTSVSDTSEFNVFQQLKIYDNYWETLFARHIVNAANAGNNAAILNQVNIQGNTEGWCRADHICLQIPIDYNYESDYVCKNAAEVKGAAINAAQNSWDAQVTVGAGHVDFPWSDNTIASHNDPYIVFNRETLKNTFKHSWIGTLDVFNRIRLLIGNNGQPIQKQIEQEPIGLKHHMSTARSGTIVDQAAYVWGIQNPHGYDQFGVNAGWGAGLILGNQFNQTVTLTNAAYVQNEVLPVTTGKEGHVANAHYQTGTANLGYSDINAQQYCQYLSEISFLSNYDSRACVLKADGGADLPMRMVRTSRTRLVTLPLQCIIPLFRGPKFLPPDFRFKFEIEIKQTATTLCKRHSVFVTNENIQLANQYRDPCGSYSQITARCLPSQIELTYPYHILRQPVQAAISSIWLQKPFLYNFEAIQTTEIIPTAGSTYVNFAISISTQRPTCLDVYLLPITSSTEWQSSMAHTGYNFAEQRTLPIRIANTPHLYGTATNPNAANDMNQGPVVWSNFEVLFSGRTAYRFQNNQIPTHGKGVDYLSTNDFFWKLWEEQSMRSTSTEYNASTFAEKNLGDRPYTTNHWKSHKVMRVILQPGGWMDRGVISSRQGATTITLNVNFNKALSADDRFVVIRTNPEQLVFDSDKNVTVIQWPAIKSNMGYLIPNITAAP